MERLKLYTVDDDYIEYLKHFDKQVMFAKGDDYLTDRKYLGVVLEINGFKYFAPLSSPKDSDYFYKNGKRLIRRNAIPLIRLVDNKRNLLGKVKLSNMIPVPENCLKLYDIEQEQDKKYQDLVKDEIICIRKCKEQILKNARVLYNQKTKNYAGINYLKSTVDFTKIEKYCKKYIRH
ncbi:MAG: type III toxin-antitoxin system ToxN/AbiQ family toxin [Candidatus Ornithomonoglobus sp.]